MKKAILVVMFVLAVAGLMMAQNWTSPTDVLGADAGSYALWGQDASPLYGKSIAFGDGGKYVEVLPSGISSGSQEVGGILLCLSCHDGNLTQRNMMQNW